MKFFPRRQSATALGESAFSPPPPQPAASRATAIPSPQVVGARRVYSTPGRGLSCEQMFPPMRVRFNSAARVAMRQTWQRSRAGRAIAQPPAAMSNRPRRHA
jgi:hypothetical protein